MKIKTIILCTACAAMLTGCADDLFLAGGEKNEPGNSLQFDVSAHEMGDLMIGIGSTRAANSEADVFAARDMEGDNPYGLSLHRMPLPYVGIHSKAVHAVSGSETRASVDEIVKSDGSNFHDSLSIWGYARTVNFTCKDLFSNEEGTLLKRIQNWRSSVLWPYDNTADDPNYMMRFYAIAPSVENLNFSVEKQREGIEDYKGPSYQYAPIFTLTLPESVADMRDVLYGESDEISIKAGPGGSVTEDPKQDNIGADNKNVPLRFSHIMTAIRFAQGGTFPANVTIKSIKLNGIYASGVYDPNSKDAHTETMGVWKIIDDKLKYSYELTNLSTNTSGTNTYIDGNQVMFMIPHVLSENAKLEVELTAPEQFKTDKSGNYELDENGNRVPDGTGTKTHIVSCELQGDVWKKGYTVTYRLTIGRLEDGYYLMAEAPEALEHNSEDNMSGSFTVHSYHSYYDYSENPLGTENTSHAVNWKIVGYDANNKDGKFEDGKPDWLTIKADEVKGDSIYEGGNNTNVEFELDAAKYSNYYADENRFKYSKTVTKLTHSGNLDITQENTVDLSNGAEETANCYIVNRKGKYTFPLVYGNKSADGDEPAGIVDHKGDIISYRSIQDQMKKVHGWENYELQAIVIWQDVEDLIVTSGVLKSGYGNLGAIQFYVNTEMKATPANAVIALQACRLDKDGNYNNEKVWETLWTWHIWMTDEACSTDTLENYDGKKNRILPVNLGWVPDKDKDEYGVYEPRKVYVKIQQERIDGKNGATAVICIEQHARQDLITGTSTIYQWGRPTALQMKNYAMKSAPHDLESAGYHITNPDKMYVWDQTTEGQSVWFNAEFVSVPEYWSTGKKTVYDPCPPGFQVPSVDIFTGMARRGSTAYYGSQLNIYPDVEVDGAYTAVSASSDAGGYFYTQKFISEQYMDDYRYEIPLVYFPVTGEWRGGAKNKPEYGLYWCSDNASKDKINASTLWIRPDWKYIGTDIYPAIQFGRAIQYSSALPIRPTAIIVPEENKDGEQK